MIKIILRKDLEKLGQSGEVVTVKDGYARNFLLPQGLGLPATTKNLKVVEQDKKRAVLREQKQTHQAQDLARKINSVSCTIAVQVGVDGKLYGSVTNQDIAQAFKAEGIEIDKKKIELPQPIKEVGVFKVEIKLYPEIIAQAKVWVVKE